MLMNTYLIKLGLLFVALVAIGHAYPSNKQSPAPDCPSPPKDCLPDLTFDRFCDGSRIPDEYIVGGKKFQPYKSFGVTFDVSGAKGDTKFDADRNALQIFNLNGDSKKYGLGYALAISSDVNAKNPTSYDKGGKIHIDFDRKAKLDYLRFYDVNTGGKVYAKYDDGKTKKYDLDSKPNKEQKINLDTDSKVTEIDIELDGTGYLLEISSKDKGYCPTPAPEPDTDDRRCSCRCICEDDGPDFDNGKKYYRSYKKPAPQPDPDFRRCRCSCSCQDADPEPDPKNYW